VHKFVVCVVSPPARLHYHPLSYKSLKLSIDSIRCGYSGRVPLDRRNTSRHRCHTTQLHRWAGAIYNAGRSCFVDIGRAGELFDVAKSAGRADRRSSVMSPTRASLRSLFAQYLVHDWEMTAITEHRRDW